MGQLPATITVTVFEPLLVPAVCGQAFVVLKGCAGDRSGVERLDSFPASRTLPLGSGSVEGEGPLLEVEVVTAADAETFRSEPNNARSFASVRVPLQEVRRLWAELSSAEGVLDARELPRSACLWLGLSEELAPEALDPRSLFERSRELGSQLGRPKVAVALHCPEPGRGSRSGGIVRFPGACSRMAPALRVGPTSGQRGSAAIKEVLGQVDCLTRGMHRHLEQARSSLGDHEALQATNVQLRTSVEQQREKYEGLIDWLKAQVQGASTGGVMSPEEDAEMKRQSAELLKLRAVVEGLTDEVEEQQARALSIQRCALSAKWAREETLKLYEAKYQDVLAMDRQLADSDVELQRLRQHLLSLKSSPFHRHDEDMELSNSPQASLNGPHDTVRASEVSRAHVRIGDTDSSSDSERDVSVSAWARKSGSGRIPASEPCWHNETFDGLIWAEPAAEGDCMEYGLRLNGPSGLSNEL